MSEKRYLIILAVIALAGICTAVYFRLDCQSLRQQLAEESKAKLEAINRADSLATEHKALLQQLAELRDSQYDAEEIAELEQLLAKREQELAELRKQEGRGGRRPEGERPQRDNTGERVGRFVQEHPEVITRVQDFMKNREESIAKIDEFFENLDTSNMTSDQKKLITRFAELRQQMLNGEGNLEAAMEMGLATENVRKALFENLAQNYGLDGSDFSDSVQTIMDATGLGSYIPAPNNFNPRFMSPNGRF